LDERLFHGRWPSQGALRFADDAVARLDGSPLGWEEGGCEGIYATEIKGYRGGLAMIPGRVTAL